MPARELYQGQHPLTPPPSDPLVGSGRRVGGNYGAIVALSAGLLAAVAGVAWWLHNVPGRGAEASMSLLIGAAFGIIMQRGRFCFFCIFRDLIEERNSGPSYALLSALATGSVLYVVVFGAFLPNPATGRLPPDAHIGPVSWVLVMAGVAFGLGMALSGACVSGHLYRLGEGYSRAPIALLGTLVGFGLGFMTWRPFYLSSISTAPVLWLPHYLGYGGALALQLVLLGLLALALMRYLPPGKGQGVEDGRPGTVGDSPPDARENPQDSGRDVRQGSREHGLQSHGGEKVTLASVWQRVFQRRWPPGITGAAVGVLGAVAYLRVAPLGVTSQIGSIARTLMTEWNLLEGRLNGLDSFSGCVTRVIHTISNNGLLISALVVGSLAMALVSGRFELTRLTWRNATTALAGGILMGWGSMLALGCTVGTLLSGTMALAVSGWVFFGAVFTGVWAGIKLRLHRI